MNPDPQPAAAQPSAVALQAESELAQLRARVKTGMPSYDSLTAAEKKALLATKEYAEHPQPIDYGLTYKAVSRAGLRSRAFKVRCKPEWELPFWLQMLWTLSFLLAMWWLLSHPRKEYALIGCAAGAVWLSGLIIAYGCVPFYRNYRDSHPNRALSARLSKYEQAVRLHLLYQKTAYEAEKAVHEAQQAALRRKQSYWECLNGYEFERATAEVLKQHQFNPRLTPGSADGGVDIEVTRNGLRGVVQCKAHMACVGPHVVRDLYGVIHHSRASFGIIVSRGGFTKGAVEFARDKPILFLDVSDLIAMQEGQDVLAAAFTGSSSGEIGQ